MVKVEAIPCKKYADASYNKKSTFNDHIIRWEEFTGSGKINRSQILLPKLKFKHKIKAVYHWHQCTS